MKDIVIKWKWIRREILILLSLYVFANFVNIISILIYDTPWSELYTSQFFVLYLVEWFYIISVVIRLAYFGVQRILRPGK